jgi:hypothetical protein
MSDNRYFRVNECVFPYFRHPYNDTSINERIVEIPLGEFFINNFGYGVTEVGAVMGYYGFNCGEVIDSHDPLPSAIKANAVYDIDYSNKNVLSISTIEHFKSNEYNNVTDNDSIVFLEKILKQAKNYLISWPLGYNLTLDEYAKDKRDLQYFIMQRVSADNKWVKMTNPHFQHLYDSPFPKANGICCVTNLESLL